MITCRGTKCKKRKLCDKYKENIDLHPLYHSSSELWLQTDYSTPNFWDFLTLGDPVTNPIETQCGDNSENYAEFGFIQNYNLTKEEGEKCDDSYRKFAFSLFDMPAETADEMLYSF